MDNQLLTRGHALSVLRTNFPFVSADECEMLLDWFGACDAAILRACFGNTSPFRIEPVGNNSGSISSLARASAADILDVTVLSAASAHAIEEFFRSEFVVE